MVSFRLTSPERAKLQSTLSRTRDAHLFRRIQALLWFSEGESVSSIARRQRVTEQSVRNWIHRCQRGSGPLAALRLSDRPHTGRTPRLKVHVEPLMDEVLSLDPQAQGYAQTTWTADLVRFHLQKAHGLVCSVPTIRRALRQRGYSWKRPRYTLSRRPKTWRQKKGA